MKKPALFLALVLMLATLAACNAEETDSSAGSSSNTDSSMEASSKVASSSIPSSSRNSSSSQSASSKPGVDSSGAASQSQPSIAVGQAPSSKPAPATPVPPSASPPAEPAPPPAEPAPAPAPSPAPTPTPEPPPAPQPSGPYAYPFDVGQIQADMVAWGQAVGMTHEAGARTPDNSSWDNPITATAEFQGDILRAKLQEYVQFYVSSSWQAYGNEPVTHFTIYVSGTTFYVLH